MAKKLPLTYGYATDVGLNPVRVAKGNQDYYGLDGPVRTADTGEEVYLFVVADGMGGHAYGGEASRRAVKVIVERFRAEPLAGDLTAWVTAAVEAAHAAVLADGRDDPVQEHRGTTVVALVVKGAEAVIGHVGDSPAFLIRQGITTRVTRPHVVGRALAQAVGHSENLYVETQRLGLDGGDVIVLATDGVSNEIRERELPGLVRAEPAHAAHNLIALANRRGGHDNATAVVVRVAGAPARVRRWVKSRKVVFLALAGMAAAAVLVIVGVNLFKGPGGKGEPVGATAATAQPLPPETGSPSRKHKIESPREVETPIPPADIGQALKLQKRLEAIVTSAGRIQTNLEKAGLKVDEATAGAVRDKANHDLTTVNAIITRKGSGATDRKDLEDIGGRAKTAEATLKDLEAKAAEGEKKASAEPATPGAEGLPGGAPPTPATPAGAETPGPENGDKVGPDKNNGGSGNTQPSPDNTKTGGSNDGTSPISP